MHSSNSHSKSVFLFLTDRQSDAVLNTFVHLREVVQSSNNRACILFHQKESTLCSRLKELAPFVFTYRSLLNLNYMPIVMDIVPGSNHFPVLQFFLEYPGYDYYWVLEDDVRYAGDWKIFFDHFKVYDHDFISSHLRTFSQEPAWIWWKFLSHPREEISFNKRIRSFNPIYRISGNALHFIHISLLNKWVGHHEVLFPTLLHQNGFKVLDFGGQGNFVNPGDENKFYTSSTSDPNGSLNEGTMRFRPVWQYPGEEKNKLYHPIKAT